MAFPVPEPLLVGHVQERGHGIWRRPLGGPGHQVLGVGTNNALLELIQGALAEDLSEGSVTRRSAQTLVAIGYLRKGQPLSKVGGRSIRGAAGGGHRDAGHVIKGVDTSVSPGLPMHLAQQTATSCPAKAGVDGATASRAEAWQREDVTLPAVTLPLLQARRRAVMGSGSLATTDAASEGQHGKQKAQGADT